LTSPAPLYAIANWLAPLDEHGLGLEPAQVDCIHDDRVGQALERFYHGRHKDVFFHLALRALETFGLDCAQIRLKRNVKCLTTSTKSNKRPFLDQRLDRFNDNLTGERADHFQTIRE